MSVISFGIRDFHAIGHAEVLLNGITVLAGVNGCGKSTIARSLYSIINSMNEYSAILKKDFCSMLSMDVSCSNPIETEFLDMLKDEIQRKLSNII